MRHGLKYVSAYMELVGFPCIVLFVKKKNPFKAADTDLCRIYWTWLAVNENEIRWTCKGIYSTSASEALFKDNRQKNRGFFYQATYLGVPDCVSNVSHIFFLKKMFYT